MNVIMGVDPTKVDDAAAFTLGMRGSPDGLTEYVYVEASAAVAQYAAALISEDGTIAELTTTTAAGGTGSGKRVCVPQVAIAQDKFGWAAIYGNGGRVKVKGAANCVKFTQLNTTATAGVLDDAATAAFVLGAVLEETLTGAAAADVSLNYPHVNITI